MAGLVELSCQLDRASSPHDLDRMLYGRRVIRRSDPGGRGSQVSRREFLIPRPARRVAVEEMFEDDVPYRLFLRSKLKRHAQLQAEDERRMKAAQRGR